jgi:hypothetical protein
VSGDSLIRKGTLSGNRLRSHTITGKQIKLSSLGTVPSAKFAATAGQASSATSAIHATSANQATTAANATHASSADTATSAGTAVSATNAGNAGNAGTLGGQAPSAYQARIQWVYVRANGTPVAQTGGITVLHPTTGLYFVSFPTPVLRGTLSATLHYDYLTAAQIGEIATAVCGADQTADKIDPVTGQVPCFQGSSNTPDDVLVETSTSAGGSQNQGFYLEAIS